VSKLKVSLILSFSQKYSELVIGFVASIILARLLMPEEVGIYSVVASITVLAHMVRDFGVSTYIIQEEKLTDEKLISAFLVTLFWSYSISILLFSLSTSISDFFGRSEVEKVVEVISINFLLIPFGSISLSLLRRSMDFLSLFKVNVASALVAAITTVLLAFYGFSYMSLVWGSVVGTGSTVLLSTFYRQKIKLVFPNFSDLLIVFKFGSKSSYINILFMSVSQLPEILIGRLYGMASVGLFSRASGLVKIFHMGIMQGILPVFLPHFVSKFRESQDIKSDYLLFLGCICTVAWPFFAFISMMSKEIIEVLYGANWVEAASFVVWLAISASIINVYSINTHIFVALKKIDVDVKNQSISQILSAIILLISCYFGLEGIMFAIILGRVVTLCISTYYLSSVSVISVLDILYSLTKPFLVVILSVILLNFFIETNFYSKVDVVYKLILSSFVFSISWFVCLVIFRSELIGLFSTRLTSNGKV
jgi:O-antigen/teichoic acid export membrane protein